jgi:hypothetical protein
MPRGDVAANSELQVRHYGLQRFVTMSAIISTGSITVESGKAAVLSKKHALYPKPQLPRWLGDARNTESIPFHWIY